MKKKNRIMIYPAVIAGALLLLLNCCKKKDTTPIITPTLTTTAISNVSLTTARSGGDVTSDGGSTVTARGICWSSYSAPTVSNSNTSDGTGTGSFTSAITGLTTGTVYYVRAYATNATGTNYGDEVIFTAGDSIPYAMCKPPINSVVYNSQLQSYTTYTSTVGLRYGNYGLVGEATNSELVIEFNAAPVTGKYLTGPTDYIGAQQCVVDGTFGDILGYEYVADIGDTVFVTQTGTNMYSMTFCNLYFVSGYTSYTFYSDGNLTVK